jgi:hypothetical protein
MKQGLLLIFSVFMLLTNPFASAQHKQTRISKAKTIERPFRTEWQQQFDFTMAVTAKGQFDIFFENATQASLEVKVYDIIGNLVLSDQAYGQGKFVKSYDLSYYKSQFFLVEVGNEKHQKLKRIAAV